LTLEQPLYPPALCAYPDERPDDTFSAFQSPGLNLYRSCFTQFTTPEKIADKIALLLAKSHFSRQAGLVNLFFSRRGVFS